MKCVLCGNGQARVERSTRLYGRGAREMVIRNVPIISCSDCHERYLIPATLHEVDRIRKNWKSLSKPRPIRVADFTAS